MKAILLSLMCFLQVQQSVAQEAPIPVYYTPVNMPESMKDSYYSGFDTRLLAADLAELLKQATGKSFMPEIYRQSAVKGIFLLLDTTKKYTSNETGLLESDGANFIRITAHFTTGISYAMYSWLEELGFHFYLPGDKWTIIPSLKSVFNGKVLSKNYHPYFKLRMFTSSGGNTFVKGLDETGESAKEWQLWHMRNRMGCDYISIGGHIGEAFNIRNQKQLEKDSMILAPVSGKRKFSVSAKLDPTYAKGVSLFSEWIVDQFKKEQSTWPAFLPFKKYFTADAGDGLNYCHTRQCEAQFKTVSDQAFSIVNEAAKKIKLENPAAGISTLAYTERADTPAIKIEPNIHIMVVATGYQRVTTAADLMRRWAKKSANISMYDYLNISATTYDKPFFNLYRYHNNLRFLKSLNIEGLNFETSLSKFGSGIQQYFILKFLCDPYTSVEDLLDQFCVDNFGAAAAPVKKLFKEWYFSDVHLQTNFEYASFSEDELGRFVKYIIDAESTRGLTHGIKDRIGELKAYVVYLCDFYELFAELKSVQQYLLNPGSRIEKTEATLTYIWKLYSTNIFHNTQLNDVLKRLLTDQQKEKWNYRKSEYFKSFTGDFNDVVNREFENVKKKYLPLAEPEYIITDSFLEENVKYSADSLRIKTTDETAVPDFVYPIDFYCGMPGELKIKYETGTSKGKENTDKVALVSVESADYSFIKADVITKQNVAEAVSYELPAKGHYRLFLSQYNATPVSYIIYPGKNLFYHNKKSLLMNCLLLQDNAATSFYPNKYVALYEPPADSITFSNLYIDAKNTSRFYASDGTQIKVNTAAEPFHNTLVIPASQENKFVFFSNSQYRLPPVLKSTAPYYFFLKFPLK